MRKTKIDFEVGAVWANNDRDQPSGFERSDAPGVLPKHKQEATMDHDMDHDEAIALLLAMREKWAEVPTLQEKWDNDKTYCVAPKAVIVPLHKLLILAGQNARTLEEAQRYIGKIALIVDWMWPVNTRQRFQVYQHGDVRVAIPEREPGNKKGDPSF